MNMTTQEKKCCKKCQGIGIPVKWENGDDDIVKTCSNPSCECHKDNTAVERIVDEFENMLSLGGHWEVMSSKLRKSLTTYIEGIEGTKMLDGSEAWLTSSGRYYRRAEPSYEKRERIAYYGLDKKRIPLAKGTCKECAEVIESKMCGDFQACKCGKSFVDTDRWMPERQRYGGLVAQPNDGIRPKSLTSK